MNVYLVKTGSILPLGKQGENLARKIQFDISRWISSFGPGTVQLLHQRSGDEAPYPVAVEQDGNLAVWTVTSADTAAAGTGRAELQYYVGDALAKSETWMTKVFPALGPADETPPEAQQGWVDQVLQAGTVATEAAEKAVNAAVRQPYPNAETGTWWVWNAESGAYEDTGISYGTGDSGGGVTDHEKLTGRDKTDQHPMSAITGLVDALAGKQPTGNYLTQEQDPTVPEWAKQPQKPSYTASEVGADPSGTASSQVSAHNTETTAHSDIRLLIQGLTERLNTIADSDDTTLDQLSEIVAYIKSNRDLIAAVTTGKVGVADIIDNLTTNVTNKPLSAAQGVALKTLIDAITVPDKLPNPNALTFTGAVTGRYDGSAPLSVEIPSGGGDGGNKPTIIFDSGEITEEVNIIGPIDISKYSRIRIFGKVYPSSNSAGKRALQIYFQNHNKRLLCNAGNGKLFDTAGNPVSFLIYLHTSANAISTHSYAGYNAGAIFDDADYAVSSMASSSDGGSLVYSTTCDFTQMHLSAQDDLSTRPFGIGTRIMVIGDE